MLDKSYSTWLDQIRERFVPATAQPAEAEEPRRLGLVLGGGGGKGAAHIGVLQVLEELELPIDLLVGSSAGGAVALLYAAGIDHETILELFRSMALRRIAVPDPTRTGLFGQRRREELLTRVLGTRTFDDLRIPCAVTAVDLVTGQVVVIDEGPLVEAILATTALPGIFPPILRDDMVLVDGGLLNNLPVNVARERGATRVIAVELNDAVPGFSLLPDPGDNPIARLTLAPQQFAVATRALSLLVNHTVALQLRENPPDLLMSPVVSDIATLDMNNPEKGHGVGRAAAEDALSQLEELRAWRNGEAEPAPPSGPEAPWGFFNLPFSLPRWGEPEPEPELEPEPNTFHRGAEAHMSSEPQMGD
jgi:NTE family protein